MLLRLYPYLPARLHLFNCTVLKKQFVPLMYRIAPVYFHYVALSRHYYWVYVQSLFSTLRISYLLVQIIDHSSIPLITADDVS